MAKTNPVWNQFFSDSVSRMHRELSKDVAEIQWTIEPAEVVDIILDSKHPLYKNDRDIGVAIIKLVNAPTETKSSKNTVQAKPVSPYIKKYPLIHEIVS